jgi:hypothetical protein
MEEDDMSRRQWRRFAASLRAHAERVRCWTERVRARQNYGRAMRLAQWLLSLTVTAVISEVLDRVSHGL